MNKLLSIASLALLLVATPVMADRYHDYRNYDRGYRYERGSRSHWGVSFGFGYSNFGRSYRDYDSCGYDYRPVYRPVYREPVYRETYVYRSYEPGYYRPAYDCGEPYYTPRYYSYSSYSYSSGNYCGSGGGYYSSYYSSYRAPETHYSVRFHYGR